MKMKPLKVIGSDELSEKLRKVGRTKTFQLNEQVFGEGDQAEFLPLVLSGKVKILRFLPGGKEVIINIFQDNEFFAIPPVYDGGTYPATAIAMEKTKLLLIYRRDFLALLDDSDEFSSLTMSKMSQLLRETTASIQNLATASPEKRVGHVLIRLVKKEGVSMPFKITLRRQDIAEMSGLTTETTIRAVRKLAEKDLLKIVHGKIILENIEPLEKFLQ